MRNKTQILTGRRPYSPIRVDIAATSGQAIWLDAARRSAQALVALEAAGITAGDILTEAALHNAMVVHAAFGGSTNLLLHIPAIAHSAGLPWPTVHDWTRVNRLTPRLVDALPNGPVGHPTVRVFLAGGVPEVMLHLRNLGLLQLDVLTAHGRPLGEMLQVWEGSQRRSRLRQWLARQDGINPGDVIMNPATAAARGLTSTVTFPTGNLAPEGSVIKSTAIDPGLVDTDGVYRKVGPEALAGGPIGRVRDGDQIEIVVDRVNLTGRVDLIGQDGQRYDAETGAAVLAARSPHPELAPDSNLPADTRLWAALQNASGGTWGGCVYDVDEIVRLLEAGRQALETRD